MRLLDWGSLACLLEVQGGVGMMVREVWETSRLRGVVSKQVRVPTPSLQVGEFVPEQREVRWGREVRGTP